MRKTTLAFLAIVAVSVAACKSMCPCDLKNLNACQSKNPPIVCIDPDSLKPSQDPVYVKGGDTVHFYIASGRGNLTITYEPGTPIDYAKGVGPHAWVHTLPVKEAKKYKYTIDVDGRKLDPDMVIEP
ncbi:MAG TPA: hypothetical protein VER58_20730 [Thermoanaerobaculia bacterium]|nr:hypothetical protein [Thermoanaerobaculia bacterium]